MLRQGILGFVFFVSLLALMMLGATYRAGATGTHFDISFDGNGRLATDFGGEESAHDIVIQPDGKIVAVGYYGAGGGTVALSRYNPDGSLDTLFDGDGRATFAFTNIRAFGVGLQTNGRIVVAGTAWDASISSYEFAVVRFLSNGSTGAWYRLNSSNNAFVAQNFGSNGDKPTPAAFQY